MEAAASEGRYAEVDGARLYHEVAGEGHPLVLLHAGIADSRMWDAQVPAFAPRFRVIRYDARGFGRSSPARGTYSHHEDLYGLLRSLDVERTHLVGVSLGSRIAMELTLTHPEMVGGLDLASPGPGGRKPSDALQRASAEVDAAMEAGDLSRATELELRLWVDGPGRTPEAVDPTVRERVREMNAAILAHESEQDSPRWLEPPAMSRLREIRAPTLIVVGEHDVPDLLKTADALEAGLGGSRKMVVRDAAHVLTLEQPEGFK